MRSAAASSGRRTGRSSPPRCACLASAPSTANGHSAAPGRVADPPRIAGALRTRAGILGVVVLVVFGALLLRLWALQVLSGSHYLRAAENNQLRTIRVQAPRGPIVDRNGRPLVTNVPGTAIIVWPSDLPKEGRYDELRKLSTLLKVPLPEIVGDIRRHAADPLSPVTIKESVRIPEVAYLSEHWQDFRGVEAAPTFLRRYPFGSLAAQVVGSVGEVTQERLVSPYDTLDCTGRITIAKQLFKNWDPYIAAPLTMPVALARSCDTYFYQLGYRFWKLPPDRKQPLQEWASRFGFGRPTGIDLGPEAAGLLPTIAWRHARFTKKTDPCCWQIDRLWKPGDSVQLAIGQKDLAVTPLQMARFYALIANGGQLVTPPPALDVEQPAGDGSPAIVRRRFAPPPPQRIHLDPSALAAVKLGLLEATHESFGTSNAIFGSFPVAIAGQTGTAEKHVDLPGFSGTMDQSWWCGYGPADNPTIVVCALIENGGHGGYPA